MTAVALVLKVNRRLLAAVFVAASPIKNTFRLSGETRRTSTSETNGWLKPTKVTEARPTIPSTPETVMTDGYGSALLGPFKVASLITMPRVFANDRFGVTVRSKFV